jgi:hypothetical protein
VPIVVRMLAWNDEEGASRLPAWLKELGKRPFDEFTFGAVGIATYQLGNFGTASKRLDRDH